VILRVNFSQHSRMEPHDDRWTQYRPGAVPALEPLAEQLAQASPDLLRSMLETFPNTLLSAQADSVCGAGRTPSLPSTR
jgi:hypothetical protein